MKKSDIDKKSNSPQTGHGAAYTKQNDIKSMRLEVISTADDNINITEPSSPTHSEYLWNTVEQSLSGHIEEIDDTPGAERTLRMHKAGTFEEIHSDGTRVVKIFGDDFYLALVDHTLFVGGNLNISVQGDANILTKGNVKQKIGGNYDLTVHGNMTTHVEGERLDYTKGDFDIQTASNLAVRSEGTTDIYSKAALDIQTASTCIIDSDDDMTIHTGGMLHVNVTGAFNTVSKGKTSITSDDKIYVDATRIDFNLPGPNVPYNNPSSNDPSDQNPTGGLTIENNITEPSIETIMLLKTGNMNLASVISSDTTYPKDRTSI